MKTGAELTKDEVQQWIDYIWKNHNVQIGEGFARDCQDTYRQIFLDHERALNPPRLALPTLTGKALNPDIAGSIAKHIKHTTSPAYMQTATEERFNKWLEEWIKAGVPELKPSK